jgi:hypothetical protein
VAEIEFTLPTIQYGNVKVRATPEELGIADMSDGSAVGIAYAVYLNLFTQGFRHGTTLDVDAPLGTSQETPPPGDPEEAARRVREGEKPRTVDEANAMATEVIKQELGATVVDEELPPWKRQQQAAAKPWEVGDKVEVGGITFTKKQESPFDAEVTAPAVADIEW